MPIAKSCPRALQGAGVDESKIAGYLLSHANGRGKAVLFLGIGFRVEAWRKLAEAIKAQAIANPVAAAVDSPYGTRYSVEGELLTPSSRRPRVRTECGFLNAVPTNCG